MKPQAPSSPLHALNAWVFSHDRRIELALKRTMMASLVSLVWTAIAIGAHLFGALSAPALVAIAAFNIVGIIGFTTALRSGWSLRFRDMGLSKAQMLYATVSMCGFYALIPSTRAAALQTMCLIMVFGTFSLSSRDLLRMGFVLASIPVVTVSLLEWHKPPSYAFTNDGMPALVAASIMLFMSWLLSHFCKLRQTLREQRGQLLSLAEEARNLAMTDELTGLFNRRHMSEQSSVALRRHQRSTTSICLAVLDIDHFKLVNDRHGHHVGDEALAHLAQVLKAQLRTTDLLARWGGEEFLVLLPDASADHARMVLERVLLSLSQTVITPTVPDLRISFSAGIAQWDHAETLTELVERADQALYQAKGLGRHRCELASLPGATSLRRDQGEPQAPSTLESAH